MGLYAKYIFPYLVNWTLGGEKIGQYRQSLLKKVEGRVLELGAGTGLNLPYYSNKVKALVLLEVNEGMHRLAVKRLEKVPFPVTQSLMNAEKISFPDQEFDSVVSTFTLCSIEHLSQAIEEIKRVLKPNGHLFFLEHGLSSEADIQRRQQFWTPYQRKLADGCHLDRAIDQELIQAGFQFLELKKFYHSEYPKMFGFFYQGVAQIAS